MNAMPPGLDATRVAALADEPLDWRYKGIPSSWWGRTAAEVCAAAPNPLDDGAVGPLCVLSESALAHNLATMSAWCRDRGVELAPHGKTHMAPQLLARQLGAGACGVTVATISQARIYRAFGADRIMMANEVVDEAGLRWLAAELDADSDFDFICWVDSLRGVELMSAALAAADAQRSVDVCVEIGVADGRTGCRGETAVDEVARAVAAARALRLVGVAGYEAVPGNDTAAAVRDYLREMRAAVIRLTPLFDADEIVVTAGGSAHFDLVADELASGWAEDPSVRTILRSGCYLTHDDGLYARTSPLHGPSELRPAMSVWAQVTSRPQPDLALLNMGRRDVSFDHDLPLPRTMSDSRVMRLNDQHAYLRLGAADRDRVAVGDWAEFGISHPCTVFDKWQLIPVLDDRRRVVDLIRTFF
jgi:D-serine deaminase-like pyridoxal phosphate-dependent protein